MRRRSFVAGALAVPCLSTVARGEKKPSPGVSGTEILLGQSLPYSGPLSALGLVGKAEQAYFRMLNDTQGGFLATAFLLAYFATSPIFGVLGDRVSRTRLLAVGVGAWSAATASALSMSFLGTSCCSKSARTRSRLTRACSRRARCWRTPAVFSRSSTASLPPVAPVAPLPDIGRPSRARAWSSALWAWRTLSSYSVGSSL